MNRKQIHAKHNGHCAYCGCEITIKEMQVDHIIPKKMFAAHMANKKFFVPSFLQHLGIDDLNHPDNLNPACRQCNFYKGEFPLEAFRNQLATTLTANIKKSFQFRLGLKYGMVRSEVWCRMFYFEK
jgi:endonuclease I